VAIALGRDVPDPDLVVRVIADVLAGAGVEADAITVVEPSGRVGPEVHPTPGGAVERHDPSLQDRIAYLATTQGGSRIYLNRTLTDADVVVPVGVVRFDPLDGPQGPWSVLFPDMSDQATRETRRRTGAKASPAAQPGRQPDPEDVEVGALLGAHFQIGLVPGSRGPVEFLAGRIEDVRDAGLAALERDWTFRPGGRAELVVAGIGGEGEATGLHELVAGLATAGRLVQRGGRIVALSRAVGDLGPSLQRLRAAGDGAAAVQALRGHEDDPDHRIARVLAHVLDWADVYLLSGLDPEAVEDLAIIPLERPEEAKRLASRASTCLLVDRADRVRVEPPPGDDA